MLQLARTADLQSSRQHVFGQRDIHPGTLNSVSSDRSRSL